MQRRLLVAVLAGLLMAAPAAAHSPLFHAEKDGDGVIIRSQIADPERSWAIYGRLRAARSADVITIDARAGQELYIQMLVPVRPELEQFRPRAYLVGPGLPSAPPATLPPGVAGPNEKVLEVPVLPQAREIYEGFTQMRLWEYAVATGLYPETGRYRLVIFDPAGQAGP